MKDGLEPGVSNELTITTTPDMGITHLGPDAPSMFSTPAMIQLIEGTCLGLMSKYFEPGEQSVGYHVDVHHLKPTQVGKKVTVVRRGPQVMAKVGFAIQAPLLDDLSRKGVELLTGVKYEGFGPGGQNAEHEYYHGTEKENRRR